VLLPGQRVRVLQQEQFQLELLLEHLVQLAQER
jgi:hypothetical protein